MDSIWVEHVPPGPARVDVVRSSNVEVLASVDGVLVVPGDWARDPRLVVDLRGRL